MKVSDETFGVLILRAHDTVQTKPVFVYLPLPTFCILWSVSFRIFKFFHVSLNVPGFHPCIYPKCVTVSAVHLILDIGDRFWSKPSNTCLSLSVISFFKLYDSISSISTTKSSVMLCIQFFSFLDWVLLLNLDELSSSLRYSERDDESDLHSENGKNILFLSMLIWVRIPELFGNEFVGRPGELVMSGHRHRCFG